MILLTMALLLLAAAPAAGSLLPLPVRPGPLALSIAAIIQLTLLAGAAILALQVAPMDQPGWRAGLVVSAMIAACLGGSGVSTAILDAATRAEFRRSDTGGTPRSTRGADATEAADPLRDLVEEGRPVLRGGAWIGLLERLAVAATLIAGWPEGLAVVLAVKGLARYSELRQPNGAAERFIIGTFGSVLWAAACAGVASLGLDG